MPRAWIQFSAALMTVCGGTPPEAVVLARRLMRRTSSTAGKPAARTGARLKGGRASPPPDSWRPEARTGVPAASGVWTVPGVGVPGMRLASVS
ncbi:hypothetical protein UK12_34140 [Saccharothrix sp. ST-888]|nr:hypothetical protein UK12_34140 [Saccharothrix sp. ST-888]